MIGKVFLLVTLTLLIYFTESKGFISRCLLRRRERIYLRCPDNHVIYKPEVFLGVSSQSQCFYQQSDCTGLSYNLMKQKNKCHWQKSCSFGWRFGDVILKTNISQCVGKEANYVAYINPLCIPEDNVFSICDDNHGQISVASGVLRSHKEYPWAYGTITAKCKKIIQIHQGCKLKILLEDLESQPGDYLVIKQRTNSSVKVLFNGTSSFNVVYTVTDGEVYFEFMTSPGAKIGRGFVIRFHQTRLITDSESIAKHVQEISDKYAKIEECVNGKEDLVHLSCPKDHVIYKPEVEVGSSNYNVCYGSHGDCTGKVHTILTAENSCYWSNYCDISWSGNIPITMTSSPYCLAMMPTYVTMSKFECVRTDNVHDICDRSFWEITGARGIIKSHEMYPWNYKAISITCRKRIRIHRKSGLHLYTDDFDLDHDTRKEHLKIWHVSLDGNRTIKYKLRGEQTVEMIERDGCLDIEFKSSKLSKAGRGFIIKFENYLDNLLEDDLFDTGVNYCGGKTTFFPKRKRSSARKSHRSKGTKTKNGHRIKNRKQRRTSRKKEKQNEARKTST